MTTTYLHPNGTFDSESAYGMIAAHTVPGAQRLNPERRAITRLIPAAGSLAPTTILLTDDVVTVNARRDVSEDVSIEVSRWLDLDVDIKPAVKQLAEDPILGPLVRSRPGVRLTGYADEFEAVIGTILGQQVSLAAARTFAGAPGRRVRRAGR